MSSFVSAFVQYKIVVEVYVTGALCAFGIAGNVLSIVILGPDRTIRRTTGFLMQMLAVADAAYLVSFLSARTLNTAVQEIDWFSESVRYRWSYVVVHLSRVR